MYVKRLPRMALAVAALFLSIAGLCSPLWAVPASAASPYYVQPGDSLSVLATRFSTSVEALAKANNITDPNFITVGQKLTIPGAPDSISAQQPDQAPAADPAQAAAPGSILGNRRLVTYYGNPYDGRMGILGQLSPQELVAALKQRVAMYQAISDKPVQGALHFIVTVAQADPGADGKARLRMPVDLVQQYADLAAKNGMLIFLDIQLGHSTIQDELAPWIPLLRQQNVHLALDPEFDMWAGQIAGDDFGHMTAAEINYAQNVLSNLVVQNGLSDKVLIVHQFTPNMLPDKQNIQKVAHVELVTDMDGFGSQALKEKHYQWFVHDELIEYAGIKLFFTQDTPLMTSSQVMHLDPVPDVIIYQ